MTSAVTRVPPATVNDAKDYFSKKQQFETDCWDVHHAISNLRRDFILLDVRGEELFESGHLPEAINLPHWKINATSLKEIEAKAEFENPIYVVYCAGPHCNGTEKAGVNLAKLNRPVKKMIGGITGWIDEGFELAKKSEV